MLPWTIAPHACYTGLLFYMDVTLDYCIICMSSWTIALHIDITLDNFIACKVTRDYCITCMLPLTTALQICYAYPILLSYPALPICYPGLFHYMHVTLDFLLRACFPGLFNYMHATLHYFITSTFSWAITLHVCYHGICQCMHVTPDHCITCMFS